MKTTTQAKHTPGPWEAMRPIGEGDYGVLSKNVNAGGNFYVATLPNGQHVEADANAALIAAAPELLEALRAAIIALEANGGMSRAKRFEVIEQAAAAIARAEGR